MTPRFMTPRFMTLRTNLIDRPWAGHWLLFGAHPIDPPKVRDLQAAYARFLAEHPRHTLAMRLSDDFRRWQPIRPEDRAAYAERVIRGTDETLPDNSQVALLHFAEQINPHEALNVVIGPDWIAVQSSHVAVDGVGMELALQAVALADFSRVAHLEPRVGFPRLAVAAARHLRAHGRDWLELVKRQPQQHTAEDSVPTIATSSWVDRPAIASADQQTIEAAAVARAQQWRKEHMPQVTLNTLVTAAVWRALREEQVPVTSAGYNGLFDLRRFLPERQRDIGGNLAKSLFVPADMFDPIDLQRAITQTTETARALPATLAGAFARRRPFTLPAEDGPLVLTHSTLPPIPRHQVLPYCDQDERHLFGFGYPITPTGITAFAARMGPTIDILTSFDARTVDPQLVRNAIGRLDDIPQLFDDLPTHRP